MIHLDCLLFTNLKNHVQVLYLKGKMSLKFNKRCSEKRFCLSYSWLGGVPHPAGKGGYPIQLAGGVPHPAGWGGIPSQVQVGEPPGRGTPQQGVPPDRGTPSWGTPYRLGAAVGMPSCVHAGGLSCWVKFFVCHLFFY